MRLEGVPVAVFGGASGLGAAAVRRLLDAGARVAIADLDAERGAELGRATGAVFVPCDVTDEGSVGEALERIEELKGEAPRIAVCTAGRGFPHRLASERRGPHPLQPFLDVLELNLVGTFNVFRLAAQQMLALEPDEGGERGLLIATASVAAFEGQVGQTAYSASKGGLVGMTLTIARDLAPRGIRAVTVAPGPFDTPLLGRLDDGSKSELAAQTPFPPRLGAPDEYGRLVVAIAENPMLNGTTIRLDGALRMAPR